MSQRKVRSREFHAHLVVPWVVVPNRLRRGSACAACACRSLAHKNSCREKGGGRGRACGGGCDDDDDDLMIIRDGQSTMRGAKQYS